MFTVVIDPIICHSSVWWMFPECWGVVVLSALPLAIGLAVVRRRLATVK